MKRIFISIFICVNVVLGFSMSARADEIDKKTKDMLEAIIAGYRNNRAKLTDFSMSGNIITLYGEGENAKRKEVAYKYWELGEKKRIDSTYNLTEQLALIGKTTVSTFTGKNTLTYLSGTGPNKVTATVLKPEKFHSLSELTNIDSLIISKQWSSHTEHIKYLLDQGWEPQKQSIKIKTVDDEGKKLLQVLYESTRGGFTRHEWTFDPQRGYEVIQANSLSNNDEGKQVSRIEASYSVNEVAPGVWRPTAVNYVVEVLGEKGERITVNKQIKSSKITANDGTIDSGLFTFWGMGVESGAIVSDETFNPPMTYQFDVDLLPDLEEALDKTFTTEKDQFETNSVQKLSKVNIPKQSENVLQKSTEESSISSVKKPELGTIPSGKWKNIIIWGLLIFLPSLLFGYMTCKKKGSPLFPHKSHLSIFVIIFILSTQTLALQHSKVVKPLLVNSDLSLYQTEGNICGITSLYYSLLEIGHKVSIDDLLASVPIDARGSSLIEMCHYMEKHNIPYQVVKPNNLATLLNALKPKSSVAILHVDNGTHFLVAKKTIDGHFIALDGTKIIKDDVLNTLKLRFSGIAVMVGFGIKDMIANFIDLKKILSQFGVGFLGFIIGVLIKKNKQSQNGEMVSNCKTFNLMKGGD